MLTLLEIDERLEGVLALMLERSGGDIKSSPPTIPIPKLKKKVAGAYGYEPDRSVQKTAAGKGQKPADGDGTKAGVAHKDVGDGTKAGVKPQSLDRDSQTKASKTPSKAPGAKSAAGKPPSCPGGGQARMVFGKWRCAGGTPLKKGAAATKKPQMKRKKKGPPPPKGTLGKLVHKAKKALSGLFK